MSQPGCSDTRQPAGGATGQFITTFLLLCSDLMSGVTTAAVCVYPSRVTDAVGALKAANSSLPVASGKSSLWQPCV